MHDLHSVEAKMDMSNTEGLMYVVSYPDVEGRDRIQTMRNATPYWAKGAAIVTPDGKTGTAISPAAADKGTEIDNDLQSVVASVPVVPTTTCNMTFGVKKKKTTFAVLTHRVVGAV